jgi:hypothetical protein
MKLSAKSHIVIKEEKSIFLYELHNREKEKKRVDAINQEEVKAKYIFGKNFPFVFYVLLYLFIFSKVKILKKK